MTFREIVEKVIQLATERDAEETQIMKDLGIYELGVQLLSKEHGQLMAAPRPKKDELKRFLDSLTAEQAYKMQTLMYLGRDEAQFTGLHKDLMSRTGDREDAIRTMMSKAPLHKYLSDGLKIAAIQKVALEASF